ncbi:radical SAM enzyme (rSAM/lipoprotein system) [Parabacteroides sp. PF5-5]|uniref:TIGR04133 family radical SAM/SPASM protein n=1 Tax=unclassified Parabacteroides TaxID=2649774 RepID=UPI0024757813|nr:MULTISPECIES: TIGR04133 family radical SAM/SPASM protein [unclassified Parabacteroides]MDH6306612.1 radical SAM enzyme (rSAM/lipoprotein system) [Parabacteroides sp. PH5-39]MDH6317579.1 radical SAM enzyme (rSAM/lipoprotein system) [Parabacteroides sp. PF5-13]MDH6321323.1 radical SAM enzyme (rSAM/lipoprotein system) [Parabacteroides sp. PH5-13]MDH6325112.1 radical SAM enzyme (rSAM/lipoprotein system) [Parabacteroides sp. PH5-8]MDH6328821.1 radical SAM enzyme (rSAM/lipoprotein system) [Paraba
MKKLSLRKRAALELFRRIRKNKVVLHELRTLFWECTLRCNISCQHCGSDCRVVADQPDMPVEDFLKVVDSITPHVNPNKVLVIFTGGEALVRKDIEVCGLELYRRGYPWGIVSNGLYLTRERLDSLLASGLHSITISLDGFEEAHNWLRCHPKSYEKALNAVRMLVEEKEIAWDIVTCANKKNIADLPAFKDFLLSIGVKNWRIFTIFPVGRASELPELQLSNDEFTAVLDFIRETRKEGKIHVNYGCEGFLGEYETEVRDHFYQCNAGVSTASVLADGSISGCPSIRANFHQGNVYNDSFPEVWENRFKPFRDRKWAKKGICADCKLFRYCEGNGMHLHDDKGDLLFCHYQRINE